MTLYSYDGPVLEFDKIIANKWHGQTRAVNEARARTNLAYQFKMETGRVPRTRITLPGKIVKQGDEQANERSCIYPEFAQV